MFSLLCFPELQPLIDNFWGFLSKDLRLRGSLSHEKKDPHFSPVIYQSSQPECESLLTVSSPPTDALGRHALPALSTSPLPHQAHIFSLTYTIAVFFSNQSLAIDFTFSDPHAHYILHRLGFLNTRSGHANSSSKAFSDSPLLAGWRMISRACYSRTLVTPPCPLCFSLLSLSCQVLPSCAGCLSPSWHQSNPHSFFIAICTIVINRPSYRVIPPCSASPGRL